MVKIANTYRFFVDPAAIDGTVARIDDPELARQIGRVLRLQPGDHILLLDGQGNAYTVALTEIGRAGVQGRVEQCARIAEPLTQLILYAALLRAERFEWVLQKGTELGISAFVPLQCERSFNRDRVDERKMTRWSRIVREAAEQSCRGRLPIVAEPMPFEAACVQATHADAALLLWEGEAAHLRTILRSETPFRIPSSISILSGPEGGLTYAELTTASERGIIPVSLGSRILRAETAPIAAVAAIFYELED